MEFRVEKQNFANELELGENLECVLNSQIEKGKKLCALHFIASHPAGIQVLSVWQAKNSGLSASTMGDLPESPLKSASHRNPNLPANVGKPWNSEAEQMLQELFSEGIEISEIAQLLQRKPGGVRARLIKLGLIADYLVPQINYSRPIL